MQSEKDGYEDESALQRPHAPNTSLASVSKDLHRKKKKNIATSVLEPGPSVILLKGLVKKTTKETLTEIFSAFGTIKYLKLPFSNQKRKNQGFAYIRFESDEVGQYLVNIKKSVQIDGKEIKIWPHHREAVSSNSDSSLGEKESPQSNKHSRRSRSDMSLIAKKIMVRGRSEPTNTRFLPSIEQISRVSLSSRWELHDFKPTNSTFFWIDREITRDKQEKNLLYRVLDDRERTEGPGKSF